MFAFDSFLLLFVPRLLLFFGECLGLEPGLLLVFLPKRLGTRIAALALLLLLPASLFALALGLHALLVLLLLAKLLELLLAPALFLTLFLLLQLALHAL